MEFKQNTHIFFSCYILCLYFATDMRLFFKKCNISRFYKFLFVAKADIELQGSSKYKMPAFPITTKNMKPLSNKITQCNKKESQRLLKEL